MASNRPSGRRTMRGRGEPGLCSTRAAPYATPYQIALFALFFLSGISGLVYETVWLRILIRVLGNTTHAASVVLAAFMAGMAIGSYVIGRYAGASRNQLRLYAVLEFGVAATAVGLTVVLLRLTPFYQFVYDAFQGNRFGLTVVQSAMTFALMLVPTCLMGGTLPVLSAHTKVLSMGFAPRMGVLYGVNTLGAVLGVLGSGFITIGLWGETVTFLIGAGITTAVAVLALALSASTAKAPPKPSSAAPGPPPATVISPYPAAVRRLVGFAYALSGFAAMSYEIVWTRMFQIHVGTSIYAFSVMLAFYLAGIGLGSLVGGRPLGAIKFPLRAFGVAQLGIALYSILGLYLSTLFAPITLKGGLQLSNALVMPLSVVLPITVVLGAMFPLVCRCYVASEADVSRAVGRLYALNTFGCIAGSLVCGFVLVWLFGTRGTILALAAWNAAIGLVLLLREPGAMRWRQVAAASAGYVAVAAVLAVWAPDPFRAAVDRVAENVGRDSRKAEVVYHNESVTATTTVLAVDDTREGKLLCVNGISMTALCVETKLMAHLPLLLHPKPESILVICFGMGTTVRSVRAHQGIRCDVVELVPEVFECFKYFHPDAAEVLGDPRIGHYADDGRNFLLMRPKCYDVISIDPAPPVWSAGTVNLYTKEFFQLCAARLNDRGIVCLWIPPVEASEMRMIMKTFCTVFPNTCVWRGPNVDAPGFYMMGFSSPADPVGDGFRQIEDEQAVLADLNEWGLVASSLDHVRLLLLMRPPQLAEFVKDVPVITDDRPYTEFPLWRSIFDPLFDSALAIRK